MLLEPGTLKLTPSNPILPFALLGEPPIKMPDGVGITAGGEHGFRTFMIEFHYNNPELSTSLFDV